MEAAQTSGSSGHHRPSTRPAGPLLTNIMKAVETRGTWWLVATYTTAKAAKSAASEFRGGRSGHRPRGLPRWEYANGKVDGQPGCFGLWVRYLGMGEEKGNEAPLL